MNEIGEVEINIELSLAFWSDFGVESYNYFIKNLSMSMAVPFSKIWKELKQKQNTKHHEIN